MSSKAGLGIVLLACVGASLVGCASRSARVIARCAAPPLPANAMKVGLMQLAQARPPDQAVERNGDSGSLRLASPAAEL